MKENKSSSGQSIASKGPPQQAIGFQIARPYAQLRSLKDEVMEVIDQEKRKSQLEMLAQIHQDPNSFAAKHNNFNNQDQRNQPEVFYNEMNIKRLLNFNFSITNISGMGIRRGGDEDERMRIS